MVEYVPFQILTAAELNASIDGLAALINTSITGLTAVLSGRLAPSVAGLRATPSIAIGPVYVAGFRAVADGGEGTFSFVASDTTSADNGGTIIVDALGRRWHREINGPFCTSWFGVVGDGVTDDTAAWQSAINAAILAKTSLFDTGGKYLISAALNITGPIHIIGCQQQPIIGYALANPMGFGTWFVLDGSHLVSVFRIDTQFGIEIEQIGTYHTQPATRVSWTPAAYPAAISIFNSADIYIHDCTLLNPTVGVAILTSVGGGGRVTLERLRGQPLTQCVVADGLTDVARFTDLHWWPFWSQDANIENYVQTIGTVYQLGRVDNPIFSNCFSFGYATGISVAMTSQGYCNLASFVNCGFDHAKFMIYIQDAGFSGHTLKLSACYCQGYPGNGGTGIVMAGTTSNNFIELIGTNVGLNDESCIAFVTTGTGNNIRVIGGSLWDWDGANDGSAMASVSAGNRLMVSVETNVFSVNDPAVLSSGAGTVSFVGTGTGSGVVGAGVASQIPFYNASGTTVIGSGVVYQLGGGLAILGVGVPGTGTGQLDLSGITSGTTALKVPSAAGNYVLTLPPVPGSAGQVLETNGAGVTNWTWGGPTLGVITGLAASAGFVGEFISSSIAVGSAVAFATGGIVDVTSIVLTPGDWDVEGNIVFTITGGCTTIQGWIGLASATGPTPPGSGAYAVLAFASNINSGTTLTPGKLRVNVSVTTTVYLSVSGTFSTGTVAASGFIGARRVR